MAPHSVLVFVLSDPHITEEWNPPHRSVTRLALLIDLFLHIKSTPPSPARTVSVTKLNDRHHIHLYIPPSLYSPEDFIQETNKVFPIQCAVIIGQETWVICQLGQAHCLHELLELWGKVFKRCNDLIWWYIGMESDCIREARILLDSILWAIYNTISTISSTTMPSLLPQLPPKGHIYTIP